MTSNEAQLIRDVATEAQKFFKNQEKERELTAFVRDKVPADIEEQIRHMHIQAAEVLRKNCKLTVPEIRRYLDEMRSLTI